MLWPWGKSAKATGPAVAVVEMNGVLRRPTNQSQRLPGGAIYFDRARKAVNSAFALPNVQAVCLDINCPGA